ncbi:MAG: ATP-dependent zinc metalloprotease FtsH, partial [Pseudomonadota bacterium]
MPKRNPKGDKPQPIGAVGLLLGGILLAWVLGVAMHSLWHAGSGPQDLTVAYSDFKDRLRAGEIASVRLDGQSISAELLSPAQGEAPLLETVAPPMGDPDLLGLLEEHDVRVESRLLQDGMGLIGWLPFLLILGFWLWTARRAAQGGMGFPGMRGGPLSRTWRVEQQSVGVRFEDVAGQESAKQEVSELVDFLRDPDRYAKVGARVPRGVLLMGPPGTGKTLLAKALAGEARVPFYSTSGSAFIELFVGVGAGRVRQMFEEARKTAPSIIFIDELDSIGRTRGTGLGGGHDEREQTLNQILAELDGFDERVAVVVLAATNRPDVLDPALLRPGRFDRHVTLSLPDKEARRAILDVHTREVPLARDVDLDIVAAGTPGFSGADLKNLVNEAAIAAARKRGGEVGPADLDDARDRVMMGTVRTLAISPKERHRIAVHEAGHAAAAFFLPDADPLFKVTIIPRGQSLGGTHMLPAEERHTLPEPYLRAQLAIMLAGQAAERLFLVTVSSGADDDIARATRLARSMVARWGMAEDIGPV